MLTPAKLNRRAAFFEQLASMIAAGVSLPHAMEMLGRNRTAGISQKVVQSITAYLKEGHTFTDSMLLASGQLRPTEGVNVTLKPNKEYWLSEFDMALLSAGEQAGRLDSSFRLLARYCATRATIIRDTLVRLLITIATLHVFLLIFPLGYLIGFVLGIVNSDYGLCMLFIVEKIIVFGGLYSVVWFFIFACQSNRGEGFRSFVESVFSIVPWLRQAIKYLSVARLSMALDALLNAGVPMIQAWRLAASACGSIRLKREIHRLTPQLETGTTPSEMVSQIRYFPEMFTHLYMSGEISGRLDESLQRLHTYFEEEGFRKLKTFSNAMNYLIYFTIAAIVGAYVISFWVKYYQNLLNSI